MKYKKEIINNLLSLGAVDFLGLLIPVITMPILSRSLGAALYGSYLLFLTVVTFGYTIVDYGILYTGSREVARNKNNNAYKDLYSYNQTVRWLLFLCYSLAIAIYAFLFLDETLQFYTLACGIPLLGGYVMTSSWFFQGMSDTRWLLYSSLLSRLLNLFVILFVVKTPDDFGVAIVSATYPTLLSGMLLVCVLRQKYKVKQFKFGKVKKYLTNSFDVFTGILAPNFYNSIPTMLLGGISDPIEFAKFAVASRICGLVGVVQSVLSKSIYPILSRESGNYVNQVIKANLAISIPIFLFFVGFGDFAIEIFLGADYVGNINYLALMSFGMVFIGIANAYGTGYFLPKGHDSVYRSVSLRVSFLSGVLSFTLIYLFGIVGGAVSVTLARVFFAVAFHHSYIGRKYDK
ncbi:oligosaccharide flippase family protein [Endozoicomonas gorgoniicola]|uniref:Oligosaccharide flippase family protein n=1 Tax=Endozoicomonas gorgoniicola TaxID=1234144 RepID=A0ABT3MV20_9GAMM|nr:oligosaccharide flippase family protein [Endozoicomonas gorgoniicola]MCW7553204.1 oligosaccharide flippase family protein [Endozoicomonas gorgoniicola]